MIKRHGFSPIGHCATRVLLRRFRKCLLGLQVLKGMKQCYSFFDRGLRGGRAGSREVHFTELRWMEHFCVEHTRVLTADL
jgi:hypothetical protein